MSCLLTLSTKQKLDEDNPEKIRPNQILFGCTGTIGETFPTEKIKKNIQKFSKKNEIHTK